MNNQTVLAALAVLAVALAHPVRAEFTVTKGELTHVNDVPVPPMRTAAQARADAEKRIAAIRAEEAKVAASALDPRQSILARGAQDLFYTGKPYLEEIGQYVFFFRHYDPELGRWTTADPSGFPDGANSIAYMAVPTSQVDSQGLFSLSTTSPSPATVRDPSGRYYVEAFEISHISAGSGMASQVASLIHEYYSGFTASISSANYNGTANIQEYGARNTTHSGASAGALDFQVTLSGGGNDFTWIQVVRSRTSSTVDWTHWILDTTGFGAPSYNSSTDPVLHDLPTIGGWTYQNVVSGASKEFYTFAATRSGTRFVIHDGFSWGGVIKE